MTLDEAIKHCEEKAKELREQPFKEKMDIEDIAACEECAEEHEQLAKWLKELKAYKEASKGDLISRSELKKCAIPCQLQNGALTDLCVPLYQIDNAPTVERPQGEWNNHTVACLLAELFGDMCACNFCGIDEWLPKKCDFANKECPDVVGVACWEQFLKHRKGGAE